MGIVNKDEWAKSTKFNCVLSVLSTPHRFCLRPFHYSQVVEKLINWPTGFQNQILATFHFHSCNPCLILEMPQSINHFFQDWVSRHSKLLEYIVYGKKAQVITRWLEHLWNVYCCWVWVQAYDTFLQPYHLNVSVTPKFPASLAFHTYLPLFVIVEQCWYFHFQLMSMQRANDALKTSDDYSLGTGDSSSPTSANIKP